MKKIIAIILSLVMVLGATAAVYAAAPADGTYQVARDSARRNGKDIGEVSLHPYRIGGAYDRQGRLEQY